MSDALIASLNARVSALEGEKQKLQNALRRERAERKEEVKELADRLAAAQAEYEDLLETAEASVNEWDEAETAMQAELEEARGNPDERVAKLESEIRKRDVLAKFNGVELGDGWTLDDVFKQFDFDPSSVEDVEKFDPAETVKGWREAKPGMFAATGQGGVTPPASPAKGTTQGQRPPLTLGDMAGRGARDTASASVRYTKSEVQAPNWMNTPRGKQILEARQSGAAEMVDSL